MAPKDAPGITCDARLADNMTASRSSDGWTDRAGRNGGEQEHDVPTKRRTDSGTVSFQYGDVRDWTVR